MDGYELGARLMQLPAWQGTRLVAITGYGQDNDRKRARDVGFHHHLVKPIELDALTAILAEVARP
jgi:CheY-like chemotaxis protein